jgi:CDGSH-type Zn-finger protein
MNSTKASPLIANRKGYYYEIKAGKRYLWCACGRSKSQPFCDGSHVGTEFLPVAFKAERDEDVIFCGCKQTGTGPFCDGAHSNLPGGYLTDDPNSPENRGVALVEAGPIRLSGSMHSATSSPPHGRTCSRAARCTTARSSHRRSARYFNRSSTRRSRPEARR